jgi:hypothetical protein
VNNFPEPLYSLAVRSEAVYVSGHFLESVKVQYARPTNEFLQLFWHQHLGEQCLVENAIKPFLEAGQLVLALLSKHVVSV